MDSTLLTAIYKNYIFFLRKYLLVYSLDTCQVKHTKIMQDKYLSDSTSLHDFLGNFHQILIRENI